MYDRYVKFVHNVAMNALASIYFHNYLRFDEMPPQTSQTADEEKADKTDNVDTMSNKKRRPSDFVDSQRPGLTLDISSGVNFINILRTAFALVDPKSVKNTVRSSVSFYAFGIYERKSCT